MPSTSNDISYELLEKTLRREQELGFKDTAIPGGLENLVEEWWRPYKVLHPDLSKWRAGVSAALENYGHSSLDERKHKIDLALGILRGRSISKGDLIPLSESETLNALSVAPTMRRYLKPRVLFDRRSLRNAAILIGAAVLGLTAYYYLSIFIAPPPFTAPAFLSPTAVVKTIATPTISTGCPSGCVEPPPGCVIKGNINTGAGQKIYHLPGGKFYDATIISPSRGERWFCTEEEARANGWRKSDQ